MHCAELDIRQAQAVVCTSKVRRTLIIPGICAVVLCGLSFGCSKAKGNLAFAGKPVASGSSFVFTLTNTGNSAVVYLECVPQMHSGGVWSNVPSIPQTNVTLVSLLPPGKSSQTTFAAPVGGVPWRLAVVWTRAPVLTPLQRVELIAQKIFTPHNQGLRNTLYTNFSAEVAP